MIVHYGLIQIWTAFLVHYGTAWLRLVQTWKSFDLSQGSDDCRLRGFVTIKFSEKCRQPANTVVSTWRQIRVEAGPYLSDKKRLQRYNGFYTCVFKVPMDEFFLSVQVPRSRSGKTRGIRRPNEKSAIMLFNSWNGENPGIRKRKQRFTIKIRFILENFPQQIVSLIFFFFFFYFYGSQTTLTPLFHYKLFTTLSFFLNLNNSHTARTTISIFAFSSRSHSRLTAFVSAHSVETRQRYIWWNFV